MNVARAGIEKIVQQHVRAEFLTAYLAQLQKCTIGELVKERNLPIGRSKIGGAPDLPVGMAYPVRNETYCEFLGQLNFAEFKPFDTEDLLPPNGLLSIYCECYHDKEDDSDAFVTAPIGPDSFFVLYFDGSEPLSPAILPHQVALTALVEHRIDFRQYWSLPRSFDPSFPIAFEGDNESEMFEAISHAYGHRFYDWPKLQVLGHTTFIAEQAIDQWKYGYLGINAESLLARQEEYQALRQKQLDFIPFLQLKVQNRLFTKRSGPEDGGEDGDLNIGILRSDLLAWRLEKMYLSIQY